MITRRGKKGTFQIRLRTPARYRDLYAQEFFRASLHTDDRREAEDKARAARARFMAHLEAMRAGRDGDAAALFESLTTICTSYGFTYQSAEQIAAGPVAGILARIEALSDGAAIEADALLGAVPAAGIPVSKTFARYRDLRRVEIAAKSPAQIRKWEQGPRRSALTFISAVGDIDILAIGRDEGVRLRRHLAERVAAGEISLYSANREIYTLRQMLRVVMGALYQREFTAFDGLDFRQPVAKRRNRQVGFSTDWIRQKILKSDALVGVNGEAADILLAMINTGARPSELVALSRDAIRLSDDIPHILIAPEGRELKSVSAERALPLVGVSLEAMARHPEGFPRYREKAGSWSAIISKHLRARGLLETPDHRAYSLRHSFADRLMNADCPDRIRDDLMGHRSEGTAYGRGADLETALRWVQRVAI